MYVRVAGKTTAARLLFRALRGYGLLRKEVFTQVSRDQDTLHLKSHGPSQPSCNERFQRTTGNYEFQLNWRAGVTGPRTA